MSAEISSAVLLGMAQALPDHPKDVITSDLSTSYEAVALLIHSYMTSLGFQLRGFDEANLMCMLHTAAFLVFGTNTNRPS